MFCSAAEETTWFILRFCFVCPLRFEVAVRVFSSTSPRTSRVFRNVDIRKTATSPAGNSAIRVTRLVLSALSTSNLSFVNSYQEFGKSAPWVFLNCDLVEQAKEDVWRNKKFNEDNEKKREKQATKGTRHSPPVFIMELWLRYVLSYFANCLSTT